MNTVVIVDVIKGTATPTPRFENDVALMSTGSARPLEDAYQLISQAGQAPVGNVCDPNYTMVAKVDKRYLGPVGACQGIHARLRTAARDYLATR